MCLVTLTDLSTRHTGLSASAELLVLILSVCLFFSPTNAGSVSKRVGHIVTLI